MKLKVCGMREQQNISDLTLVKPDFMGFIFYNKSARNISGSINMDKLKGISKVGVFVNESLAIIEEKVKEYNLDYVQLHGNESTDDCRKLKHKNINIIKAFSVDNSFDFNQTNAYEEVCDFFLFDTKGDSHGGNGIKFNWNILENYKGKTQYLLSGGISEVDVNDILKLHKADKRMLGVDVNSKFEIKAALKDIKRIKKFKSQLGLVD